jgi:hypothetical protein
MNTYLNREYFVLKTGSGDAIGLATMIVPSISTPTYNFSLHRPERKNTDGEFMDLMFTSIDFAEFETHRDAFETYKEVDVVETWTEASNTITHVLVKKSEDDTDA